MQTRNKPTIKLRGGPHGIPRPVVEQVQRERLYDAVLEVVADNGYRGTTVHKVLERAKISRRTFYELFDDLDGCFLGAYERATDAVLGAIEARCAEGGPPEQRVEGALRVLVDICTADPQLARACIVEVLGASEAARARRAETMERLTARLTETLSERWGGEDSARLRAQVLVGGIHELLYDRIAHGDLDRLPELADRLTRSFLHPGATVADAG